MTNPDAFPVKQIYRSENGRMAVVECELGVMAVGIKAACGSVLAPA